MLEIVPAPANVVFLRFSGMIGADDVECAFAELHKRLIAQATVALMVDLGQVEGFATGAFSNHARMSWLLRMYPRIPRGAVVTERHWLPRISELAAWLLPRTELHAFDVEEGQLALAWMMEAEPRLAA